MSVPKWADEQISRELPVLLEKGEGQCLEYMQSFPTQARELAKEIAAFASSGGGRILIGVDNAGGLVGIPNADDAEARDGLVTRVEKLSRGTVNPSVTPRLSFAMASGKAVLCVEVGKQSQPVYYVEGRPIVRHLTESRAASPQEVIDRFRAWSGFLSDEPFVELATDSDWIDPLRSILVEILVVTDEFANRMIQPAIDGVQCACENWATQLRELRLSELQEEEHLGGILTQLADDCDKLAMELRLNTMGSFPGLCAAANALREKALKIKSETMDGVPNDPADVAEARRTLKLQARTARDLIGRMPKLVALRFDDLKDEASSIGAEILPLTYHPVNLLADAALNTELREAAKSLHLAETAMLSFGEHERFQQEMRTAVERIEKVAATLD